MPNDGLFSLAQLTGYVAAGVGVFSFLQKDDRKLRTTIGAQSLSYAVHFLLLGSVAASVAALASSARTFISLHTRAKPVAFALIAINVVLGYFTADGPIGWLPVVGSCIGTVAFFWFEGIAMRLVLLSSTACWLTNNVIVGSIGGTLLELFIALVNASTCYRIWQSERAECLEPLELPSTPNA